MRTIGAARNDRGHREPLVAGAGFVGQRLPLTQDSQRRISKDKALSMGFRLVEWDGKSVHAIPMPFDPTHGQPIVGKKVQYIVLLL